MPVPPVPFVERVDPDYRDLFAVMPPIELAELDDVAPLRRARAEFEAGQPRPEPQPAVTITDHSVASADGVSVTVRLYRPDHATRPGPAYYWIHGGGYVLGGIDRDDPKLAATADELGAVVVAVDYRVAPEYPYPAPLDDCWAGYVWLTEHADDLGIDPGRLAVGGASAGGGLAAALCLRLRDAGVARPCLQVLHVPMLDDRTGHRADDVDTHPATWNLTTNRLGWRAYLGDRAGGDEVTDEMAPGRADSLSALPPTVIITSDVDLFVGENLRYAERLSRCGVSTELLMYRGLFHGAAAIVPQAAASRRWVRDELTILRRHLEL